MKSVRLDDEDKKQLQRAAEAAGVSESEFIRQAIRSQADRIMGSNLEARLADVIGTIKSKGGRARNAHGEFGRLLKKERKQRRS